MNTLNFLLISFLYVISPGPAVFVVLSKGLNDSFKSVFIFLCGNSTGLLILAFIAANGLHLGADINLYINIFAMLYFAYLGFKLITKTAVQLTEFKSSKTSYLEGLGLSLTNPKAMVFMIAVIPQFATIGVLYSYMVFGILFVITSFSSLCLYGLFANKVKTIFSNPIYVHIYNKISGIIFILFSIYIFIRLL